MLEIPNLQDIIPEGKIGTAEVKHYEITDKFSKMTKFRAAINH